MELMSSMHMAISRCIYSSQINNFLQTLSIILMYALRHASSLDCVSGTIKYTDILKCLFYFKA